MVGGRISRLSVRDVRFPTSLGGHGSDAMRLMRKMDSGGVELLSLWEEALKLLCTQALKGGWTRFKVKVGADLQDDIRRCRLIRNMIGPEKTLVASKCRLGQSSRACEHLSWALLDISFEDTMMDANQHWDVPEAVEWMAKLAEFEPLWIKEPTSPDDILGHATISKALIPLGIGVATGEQEAGYSTDMKEESIKKHQYPDG